MIIGKDRTKARKGMKVKMKERQRVRRVISDATKKVEIRRKQVARRRTRRQKEKGQR